MQQIHFSVNEGDFAVREERFEGLLNGADADTTHKRCEMQAYVVVSGVTSHLAHFYPRIIWPSIFS